MNEEFKKIGESKKKEERALSLCIIPARGGSKRIPGKNLKQFIGKPIIAYSIEVALECELFDEVMVSTDDPKIAKISKKYGAIVPFMRSANNSNDYASTVDVLVEVIDQYHDLGKNFDYACCIYPTAPFVTSHKLRDSFSYLKTNQFDTVFPVTSFSYPIQRALKRGRTGRVSMLWPEKMNARSQDLKTFYHDAGQYYWFRPEIITMQKELWTKNTGSIIYPETEVQDIDTPNDWDIAEMKYKLLNL